jgi:uncharacterized SAM-binding protein YcdF (DUF218 family)
VLWALLRPNTLALALATLGLLLVWRGRRFGRWPLTLGPRLVPRRLLPAGRGLPHPAAGGTLPRPAQEPAQVTGIVVLGGAVEQDLTNAHGIPALNGAAERMTEAVALALRHPAARLVFTGGTAAVLPGGPTEAETARRLFTSLGLAPERLVFEEASRNTHENAVLTWRMLDPKPEETWLLVTSASHMPRSVGVFRQAGWRITPWPVNYTASRDPSLWWYGPFPSRLNQAEWALREYVGLAAYWMMGRTSALFPAP